jgi:hypothetical protein
MMLALTEGYWQFSLVPVILFYSPTGTSASFCNILNTRPQPGSQDRSCEFWADPSIVRIFEANWSQD